MDYRSAWLAGSEGVRVRAESTGQKERGGHARARLFFFRLWEAKTPIQTPIPRRPSPLFPHTPLSKYYAHSRRLPGDVGHHHTPQPGRPGARRPVARRPARGSACRCVCVEGPRARPRAGSTLSHQPSTSLTCGAAYWIRQGWRSWRGGAAPDTPHARPRRFASGGSDFRPDPLSLATSPPLSTCLSTSFPHSPRRPGQARRRPHRPRPEDEREGAPDEEREGWIERERHSPPLPPLLILSPPPSSSSPPPPPPSLPSSQLTRPTPPPASCWA